MVLPPDVDLADETLQKLLEEAPAVIPVTCEDLVAMVSQRMKEN